jgi:ATP-binding cassette subfamily B (MDR/TAP) protein 9
MMLAAPLCAPPRAAAAGAARPAARRRLHAIASHALPPPLRSAAPQQPGTLAPLWRQRAPGLSRAVHHRSLRSAARASAAAAAADVTPAAPVTYAKSGGNWWLQIGGDADSRLPPPEALSVVAARLGALVRQDGPLLLIAAFFMVAAALAELSIPMFLSRAIAAATSGGGASFTSAVRTLAFLALAFGALSGARGASFSVVNQRLVRRLREQLFSALLRQPVSFFDTHDVGELTSRLGADAAAVARAVCTNVNVLARNALQVVIGSALLAALSPPLALAAAGVTVLLWAVTERYGRFSRRAARALQDATAGANRVAEEAFSLARTVRASGTEDAEGARYGTHVAAMHDINSRQSAAYGIYVSASNSLYHLANAAALALAGAAAMSGGAAGLSAETLTTFVLYVELVLCAALAVSDQWPAICDALGAGERVLALAAAPPAPLLAPGVLPTAPSSGAVQLRDVWFSYPGRPPALCGVSLALRPGETVALVGTSGSGKTTLAALLQRLYDPTSGEVLLDGVPLTSLDATWFRRQLGVVSQEPRLFSDTVCNNIAYGLPDATPAAVQAAARAANAHDFIMSLPKGYDTMVGAGGLSGGQKQRIAIARALVRNPALLILDEATSALDAESEALVQAALDGAMRGAGGEGGRRRTCLVIAHRLSTVRRADRIVVLHGGAVAEEGTHDELVRRKGGIYAQLVARQRGGLDDDETFAADMAPHSGWPRAAVLDGSGADAGVTGGAAEPSEAEARTRAPAEVPGAASAPG